MATAVDDRTAETVRLAREAYEASACKTHPEFCALFPNNALPLRSFRAWLGGEQPAMPMAQLMLREFIAGWRPGGNSGLRRDVARACDLMEHAATMIARECPDATLVYDAATCDGTCLHDDLNASAEDLRLKIGRPANA